MTKLVCTECRHDNEPERIYCHNCGARLDRSVLAQEKPDPNAETDAQTQRRLRKLLDPRGPRAIHTAKKSAQLVGGALLLAVIIQLLSAPDVPPKKADKSLSLPPSIGIDLEALATSRRTQPLTYTEEQVDAYLASTLRGKKNAGTAQFERLLAAFDEGSCRITMEKSLFGVPLYASSDYAVRIDGGNLISENLGGAIGRMPIHPKVMKYADVLFRSAWTALDHDRKLIAKLGAIEFHPQSVVLAPKTL